MVANTSVPIRRTRLFSKVVNQISIFSKKTVSPYPSKTYRNDSKSNKNTTTCEKLNSESKLISKILYFLPSRYLAGLHGIRQTLQLYASFRVRPSHPLALNNCSLRLTGPSSLTSPSLRTYTRTCTSI